MKSNGLLGVVLATVLTGCVNGPSPSSPPTSEPRIEIRYVTIPAELIPSRPKLEDVPAKDLQCLSDQTYTKFVQNFKLLNAYSKELEALLRSPSPVVDK